MNEAEGKEKINFFYRFIRSLSAVVFHTVMPVVYHGFENIENEPAPYVIVCNHLHALDPLAIGNKLKKHKIIFLGKKELTEKPIGKWFCSHLGMIPVDRQQTDITSLRSCLKVLKEGGILGIFPEGTRHNTTPMGNIKSGAFLIALRSRVPIQPVYIDRKLGIFRKTNVYYGKRMVPADLWEKGCSNDVIEELAERVKMSVLELGKKSKKNL